MPDLTEDGAPDLRGEFVIVTGGASGIGFETAAALGRMGAEVTIAGRDEATGREAVAELRRRQPGVHLRFVPLDLASLASVRAFAEARFAEHAPIALLVNNAGVMMLPHRDVTEDGFERQF